MAALYCPACGTKLIDKFLENEGLIPYCESCGEFRFPQYNVAVSMIVRNRENGKILLIQQYGRKRNVLVAGYVSLGEAAEHAVVREVREETGMTVSSFHFNRTEFYAPSNTLMCNFTAWVENDHAVNTNEEIDQWNWFTPEEAKENIAPGSLAERFLVGYLSDCE